MSNIKPIYYNLFQVGEENIVRRVSTEKEAMEWCSQDWQNRGYQGAHPWNCQKCDYEVEPLYEYCAYCKPNRKKK